LHNFAQICIKVNELLILRNIIRKTCAGNVQQPYCFIYHLFSD